MIHGPPSQTPSLVSSDPSGHRVKRFATAGTTKIRTMYASEPAIGLAIFPIQRVGHRPTIKGQRNCENRLANDVLLSAVSP